MRIISIKRGYSSDHSSTSYEFLAVDKPLGKKEKAAVSSLSSRAVPTSRRVDFTYHVDGYDIPGGWTNLMAKYYDVMYREDYDWWTLAVAFNTTKEKLKELYRYEFSDENELGISIDSFEDRAIVIIHCRINMGYSIGKYDAYEEYFEDDDEYDEDEYDEDELLNLLVQVRRRLVNGDYSALYKVWEVYGNEGDKDAVPKPAQKGAGDAVVEQFYNLLDNI